MIKSKVLVGVSIAVALGATATGGSLLIKPTITNKIVYTGAISKVNNTKVTTKSNQEVNVTMYIPKSSVVNHLKQLNHFAYLNGQYISYNNFIKGNPLGVATLKNYNGNLDMTPATNDSNKTPSMFLGELYSLKATSLSKCYYNQINVKIPSGTKFNVLWVNGNDVEIEYKGSIALISKNYLNMTGIPTTAKEILNTFAKSNNEQYIGTAIAKEDSIGAYPAITFNPKIKIQLNGVLYSYPIKPGTKVNVINKGNRNNVVVIPTLNIGGHIEHNVNSVTTKYVKVEYNGIVGYMRPETIGAINHN